MKTIQTVDVHGNKYKVTTDSLKPSIHVYGIATDGDKALIVPEFDGYD